MIRFFLFLGYPGITLFILKFSQSHFSLENSLQCNQVTNDIHLKKCAFVSIFNNISKTIAFYKLIGLYCFIGIVSIQGERRFSIVQLKKAFWKLASLLPLSLLLFLGGCDKNSQY